MEMTYTLWPRYYESSVYTWDYLNSPQFLNSTSTAGPPRECEEKWQWELKRGRKIIDSGIEASPEDALRKAIALGWPRPKVVYFDKQKQAHTPLPEDSEPLNAIMRV